MSSFFFFFLFSSSKGFESISCPTNAVYPLGCETSAVCSPQLLELFLAHRLTLFFLPLKKDALLPLSTGCDKRDCSQRIWYHLLPAFEGQGCGDILLFIVEICFLHSQITERALNHALAFFSSGLERLCDQFLQSGSL